MLHNSWPSHSQRLWLAGFLKSAGYSADAIVTLIERCNRWSGFSHEITKYQVTSLFKCKTKHHSRILKKPREREFREYVIPPELDELNKRFFEGALRVAYEYAPGKFNHHGEMSWRPDLYSIYRTIEGNDHYLFVIDVDGIDLKECLRVSQEVYQLNKWDYYRFSGNRGFHLIQKRKGEPDYEAIKKEAADIARTVGTTFEYKAGKRPNIDPRMFHRHQLIRGFCVHMKTGKWARILF